MALSPIRISPSQRRPGSPERSSGGLTAASHTRQDTRKFLNNLIINPLPVHITSEPTEAGFECALKGARETRRGGRTQDRA